MAACGRPANLQGPGPSGAPTGMDTTTPFEQIRFVQGPNRWDPSWTFATEGELRDFVARPDFEFVTAEPYGTDPRAGSSSFAQVMAVDGSYAFEVHDGGEWDTVLLESPEAVARAFVEWATNP